MPEKKRKQKLRFKREITKKKFNAQAPAGCNNHNRTIIIHAQLIRPPTVDIWTTNSPLLLTFLYPR